MCTNRSCKTLRRTYVRSLGYWSTCCVSHCSVQGFVVAAVEHNDGSAAVTILPETGAHLYEPLTASEKADATLSFRRRNAQLHVRVTETLSSLDSLLRAARGEQAPLDRHLAALLMGRLDAQRVGVFGHSFGAATAVAAAARDTRITAAVLLDAWQLPLTRSILVGAGPVGSAIDPKAASVLHTKPVLALFGDEFSSWKQTTTGFRTLLHHNALHALDRSHQVPAVADAAARASDPATTPHALTSIYTMHQMEHQNFCDLALFGTIPMRWLKSIGAADPSQGLRNINTYVLVLLPSCSPKCFTP
jgi:pimeloyl-ACP methyl ester carboxylesterase